ncbi:MAG: hypothetical protein AAGM22_00560 [Acidobacteriota bacterium]
MSDPPKTAPTPRRTAARSGVEPAAGSAKAREIGPIERHGALVLAVIAVGLAFVALTEATSWAQHRRGLVQLMDDAGLSESAAVRRIEREGTPHHAKLLTARALIYSLMSTADGDRRRELAAQLPEARGLAGQVLKAQPNSWQAAMLLGTAVYLERSIGRDERLYTEARDWEAPLLKAVRDAEGHPEPRRLLATAYLEVWHALSPDKREHARALLKQVFADDVRAFQALSPAWFELGLSLDESLEIVPEVPQAWASLTRSFADRKRHSAFIVAHRRYLDALESTLEERKADAELRLRLGDYYESRSMFLRLLQEAPPSMRFLPIASRSLELYPPGLHGISSTDSLGEWVDWALELARLDIRTFSPQAMGRLLDAMGEIEPEKAAQMALLAEEPYQAERFEKLAQPLTLVSWAPYVIAKAKRQAADGDGLGARDSLAQVGIAKREELPYLIASRLAASAVGDLPAEAEARARLEEERSRAWDTLKWRWRRGRPTLEMLPRGEGARLDIEILDADSTGGVVEVRFDGATVALQSVYAGQRLTLDLQVDSRPHLLEIQPVSGGNVSPGRVTLR